MQGPDYTISEDDIISKGEEVASDSRYAPKDYETDVIRKLKYLGITVDSVKDEVELSQYILGKDTDGNSYSLNRMPAGDNPNHTINSYVESRKLFCKNRGLSEYNSATNILEYLKRYETEPIKDGFGGGGKSKKRIKSKKRKSNRKSRKSKRRKTRRKKR